MQVREAVAEAGAQVEQRRRRLVGHAPVAVGGAGDHALEQAQHAADALDAVEGGHEVHLGGAGVREAHVDPARHQRPRQTLRPVHGLSSPPIAPASRNAAIASASSPSTSRKTSSVCSPRVGAGARTEPGVSDRRTGTPTILTLPARG